MPENEERETREKRNTFRVAIFSRRQFLERTGTAAVGALITSLAMTLACKTGLTTIETTTGDKTTQGGTTGPTGPASSSEPTSSNPVTTSSSPATPTTSASTTQTTTTPVTSGYSYVAPTVLPPLLPIAGTTCNVATDRKYSTDNIWVKPLSDSIVVIGVSTTMIDILANPYHLSLPNVGNALVKDDAFGALEGTKMSADLITPVSGTVLEVNEVLNSLVKQDTPLTPLMQDPYNSGWMIVVQLSNPTELDDLVTPQKYIELVEKKY